MRFWYEGEQGPTFTKSRLAHGFSSMKIMAQNQRISCAGKDP